MLCLRDAESQVTVRYFGGVRERKYLYCADHLSVVQLNLAGRETSEITHIEPIEKGTTVSKKDIDFQAAITRLKESLTKEQKRVETLVTALHEIANEAEASDQSSALPENIDDLLEELDLPSRKKHFELIFTVPVQLRVEGDYASKEAMREAFNRGEIKWEVTDFEETIEDDLEIIEIVEMQS